MQYAYVMHLLIKIICKLKKENTTNVVKIEQ